MKMFPDEFIDSNKTPTPASIIPMFTYLPPTFISGSNTTESEMTAQGTKQTMKRAEIITTILETRRLRSENSLLAEFVTDCSHPSRFCRQITSNVVQIIMRTNAAKGIVKLLITKEILSMSSRSSVKVRLKMLLFLSG